MRHRLLTAGGAAALALVSAATPAAAMPPAFPAGAFMPVSVAEADLVERIVHRRGFYAVGGIYYYNGYRGFVVARPGYRYHNGYWFPPAAFAAGVAAGRALTPPLPAAHIRWCYAHYRSYRAYDNSYQPHYGPRQPCWSPYS